MLNLKTKEAYHLVKSSYLVQGISVHILCESSVHLLISNYFNSLYRGEKRFSVRPLEFKLTIMERPPSLPAGSIRVVQSPYVTSYSCDKEIYFVSEDGSILRFNPSLRNANGFLTQEILNDPLVLHSLLGTALAEAFRYHGLYFLHSAALSDNKTGYLISGDGGCGKTTTSLSLVRDGFKFASDDSLLLEELNGEMVVHSLYSDFHMDQNLAQRFSEVIGVTNFPIPHGAKISANVSEIFPGSFVPQIKPSVIVFPKIVSEAESKLYHLNKLEVYRRLLKQIVLAADKEVSRNQLKALEKLVKQTVGFELLSGRDVYEDPGMIRELISQVNI